MTLPRFYLEPPLAAGRRVLPETEAHHLRTVLRMTVGAEVEVFDGAGRCGPAVVVAIDKRRVEVEVQHVEADPAPATRLILATAVPKGDRFDWLVEKATELGVQAIIPLRTQRSTVDPRDHKLERLRQAVISACKQSGRNDLLTLHPVRDFSSLADELAAEHAPWWLAHPGGVPCTAALLSQSTMEGPTELVVAVGPEGGWTEEEVALAERAGAHRVSLGRHILRMETAAIVLAAVVATSQ